MEKSPVGRRKWRNEMDKAMEARNLQAKDGDGKPGCRNEDSEYCKCLALLRIFSFCIQSLDTDWFFSLHFTNYDTIMIYYHSVHG